jgi:hypothetical protein
MELKQEEDAVTRCNRTAFLQYVNALAARGGSLPETAIVDCENESGKTLGLVK